MASGEFELGKIGLGRHIGGGVEEAVRVRIHSRVTPVETESLRNRVAGIVRAGAAVGG
jgi:hypothetical protein